MHASIYTANKQTQTLSISCISRDPGARWPYHITQYTRWSLSLSTWPCFSRCTVSTLPMQLQWWCRPTRELQCWLAMLPSISSHSHPPMYCLISDDISVCNETNSNLNSNFINKFNIPSTFNPKCHTLLTPQPVRAHWHSYLKFSTHQSPGSIISDYPNLLAC